MIGQWTSCYILERWLSQAVRWWSVQPCDDGLSQVQQEVVEDDVGVDSRVMGAGQQVGHDCLGHLNTTVTLQGRGSEECHLSGGVYKGVELLADAGNPAQFLVFFLFAIFSVETETSTFASH